MSSMKMLIKYLSKVVVYHFKTSFIILIYKNIQIYPFTFSVSCGRGLNQTLRDQKTCTTKIFIKGYRSLLLTDQNVIAMRLTHIQANLEGRQGTV